MAARMIRSTLTRFVLVAGLAVALFFGSVAVGQPTDASAAMSYCTLGDWETAIAESFEAAGNLGAAIYHYGRASAFYASC